MILAPADESRDGSSIPETPFATLRGRRHCPATDARRWALFRSPLEISKVVSTRPAAWKPQSERTTGSIWNSITG